MFLFYFYFFLFSYLHAFRDFANSDIISESGISRQSRPMPFVLHSAFSFFFWTCRFIFICVKFNVKSPLGASVVKKVSFLPQVTKNKTWKDIAGLLGIGASSSAAYTLRKHYTKHLLAFECHFDRGGVDPQPIINQVEAGSKKKGSKGTASVPSPGKDNLHL